MTRGTVCRHAEAAVHLQVQCTAVCNPSRLNCTTALYFGKRRFLVTWYLLLYLHLYLYLNFTAQCTCMNSTAGRVSTFYIITVHSNEVAGLIAQRKVLTANLPTPQRPRYRHKAEKHFQIYNNVQFMEPFFL